MQSQKKNKFPRVSEKQHLKISKMDSAFFFFSLLGERSFQDWLKRR